jgi:hypothetical protein
MERVRRQRERLARRERKYDQEISAASEILKTLGPQPAEAHAEAQKLASRIVDGLMGSESVVIQLMSQKVREAGLAFHSINVMVLSLLLSGCAQTRETSSTIFAMNTVMELTAYGDSGQQVLDQAALRIVRLAAPFAPFTGDLNDVDVLEIIRTWRFARGDRLSSN